MTYTFVRIKILPNLSGWYLAIRSADIDLTMDMHKSAAISMFNRFFLNPHVFDQKTLEPKHEGYEHYHPVKLAAGWLNTALKGLMAHGVIYMNTAHGLLFGDAVEILETLESEKLEYPAADNKDEVKITITSWERGQHFYLVASNNQVFSRPKFDTLDEAQTEAKKYAHEKNIAFKPGDGHFYKTEGD